MVLIKKVGFHSLMQKHKPKWLKTSLRLYENWNIGKKKTNVKQALTS